MLSPRSLWLYSMACCVLLWSPIKTMAIEEPAFVVVGATEDYELRRYAPYLIAETEVEGTLSTSGRKAFRILADYIFGNNRASRKMAMTAPVESTPATGVKMAMTAPVESQPVEASPNRYVYGFVMEEQYTLDTLPMPNNPAVSVRQIPERVVAVYPFSGRWTPERVERHERQLIEALARDGWQTVGEMRLARFNGPMTPWFMRRNEVQVPVVPSRSNPQP